MNDLIIKFSDEMLAASREEQSKVLDREIERFSKFMEAEVPDIRARGPLLTQEKMLIKTFLVQKITGKLG